MKVLVILNISSFYLDVSIKENIYIYKYKISRIGKSIEIENKLIVVRRFWASFELMKIFLESDCGDG